MVAKRNTKLSREIYAGELSAQICWSLVQLVTGAARVLRVNDLRQALSLS